MLSSRKYKQQLDLDIDLTYMQENAVADTEIAHSHRSQPPMKRVKRVTIHAAAGTFAENLQRS